VLTVSVTSFPFALMMEAVCTFEASSFYTRLHGPTSVKTVTFMLVAERGSHVLDILGIACEKKVFSLHPQSRCYNDDV
jgi:hypothetical protein